MTKLCALNCVVANKHEVSIYINHAQSILPHTIGIKEFRCYEAKSKKACDCRVFHFSLNT